MSILIEIRKKLLEQNKTITWLSTQLGISRRTFYRRINNQNIEFIKKVNTILKQLDK